MSLLKRFLFYFSGFAIGIVLLYFFVGGSGASCEYSYGPTARTLKSIRSKERIFSEEILQELKKQDIDTSAISYLLKEGNVLFSESDTKTETCKMYKIEGKVSDTSKKKIKIKVENCEKEARILKIES